MDEGRDLYVAGAAKGWLSGPWTPLVALSSPLTWREPSLGSRFQKLEESTALFFWGGICFFIDAVFRAF